MSKIKLFFVIVIMGIVLQSCFKKQLIVTGINSTYNGIITQSLNISSLTATKKDNSQILLVCFSEIITNTLVGISCQNDTGFHLFSGGLKNGHFNLDKISSYLLKIKPITLLNYIRLSLFSEYEIINKLKYKITIDKNQEHTVINDFSKNLKVEIDVL